MNKIFEDCSLPSAFPKEAVIYTQSITLQINEFFSRLNAFGGEIKACAEKIKQVGYQVAGFGKSLDEFKSKVGFQFLTLNYFGR